MPTSWKGRLLSSVVGRMAPLALPLAKTGTVWILNYHRIYDTPPSFLLDNAVVSATPDEFDEEMRFCKANFDVIAWQDLRAICDGITRPPKRSLLITFDDGYEDNYRCAFPILKHHGLPAMFFLVVDHIDRRRLFWWDVAACVVKTHDGEHLDWELDGQAIALDTGSPAKRQASVKTLLSTLKTLPDSRRLEMLVRLRAGALVDPETLMSACRQTMTWAEVREMAASGMEIGSHSMSHPILSHVDGVEALKHEIADSKTEIEARIGREVFVFSYPVGGPLAWNTRVRDVVRESGYRFAVTYVHGVNTIHGDFDAFALKRLHVDQLEPMDFRIRLCLPPR
jgi:peptidoglycan/xylan/chitin deacetylase (PgdA/CDA1 family)